jgi:hypothetical protein
MGDVWNLGTNKAPREVARRLSHDDACGAYFTPATTVEPLTSM